MRGRPYIFCPKADCIDIWTVVEKWTGIPTNELNRLVNDGTLQLYKKSPPHCQPPHADDVYLKPYVGAKIKFEKVRETRLFGEDTFEKGLVADDGLGEMQHVLDTASRKSERYFFLLANVKQLEKDHPNFLALTPTPTLSPIEKENEALQAKIYELEANAKQHKEENAALRDDSARAKQENEGLQAEVGELKAAVAQRNKDNATLRDASARAEQKNEALRAKIDTLEVNIAQKIEEIATLCNASALAAKEKEALQAEIIELEAAVAQKIEECTNPSKDLALAEQEKGPLPTEEEKPKAPEDEITGKARSTVLKIIEGLLCKLKWELEGRHTVSKINKAIQQAGYAALKPETVKNYLKEIQNIK